MIWVGNDDNKPTGLYGSTGGMRVWSNLFKRLPSAPLKVGDTGLDWQWVVGSHTTDAGCPGARRFAFVAGFAPSYQPCQPPEPVMQPEESGGWREWFGFGRDDEREPEPEPAPQPQDVP